MNNDSLQERLFNLQNQIEECKAREHEAKGALASLKDQLRTQYHVETVEAAKSLLAKTEKEISVLTEQLEKRLRKLEALMKGVPE